MSRDRRSRPFSALVTDRAAADRAFAEQMARHFERECPHCGARRYIKVDGPLTGCPQCGKVTPLSPTERAAIDASKAAAARGEFATEEQVKAVWNQAAWDADCRHWHGRVLTGRYKHWCAEWDGLPIDDTCPEWPCGCAISDAAAEP